MPASVRDMLAVIGGWFVVATFLACLHIACRDVSLAWRRRKLHGELLRSVPADDQWQDLFDRTRPCPPFPAEN